MGSVKSISLKIVLHRNADIPNSKVQNPKACKNGKNEDYLKHEKLRKGQLVKINECCY